MKAPTLAFVLALGVAVSAPMPRDVQAGYTGIQRCKAADGTTVYTDTPCDALGARPAAMTPELSLRLASAAAGDVQMQALDDSMRVDAMLPAAEGTPMGRRSLLAGCARSPTQLAMDVQGSVALHDVNRLAESYHWVGMTQRQAMPVMKHLERISQGTVAATQFYSASIGESSLYADAGEAYPDDGRAGILQVSLHGDGSADSLQLNVERYAGCYFVRF